MEDGLRKNHRFEGFDYSNKFSYYVTICTLNKKKLLSEIILYPNEEPYYRIIPTETGKAVLDAWNKIPELYDNVSVEAFVLMPNHIHGVFTINGRSEFELTEQKGQFGYYDRNKISMSSIIRGFKSFTTREYKKICKTDESLWQKSFYDEIIINLDHYRNVCNYIASNPLVWANDDGEHKRFK